MPRLTPREMQVLRYLADGKNIKQIAFAMCVSRTSVWRHIEHIKAKFGARSREEAMARACWMGVISPIDGCNITALVGKA